MTAVEERFEDHPGVEVHHVDPTGDGEEGFVRFDCPSCGKEIHESFQMDALQMLVHPGGGCRLVVDVDPLEKEHRILVVRDDNLSLEQVQRMCWRETARQMSRTQVQAAQVRQAELDD